MCLCSAISVRACVCVCVHVPVYGGVVCIHAGICPCVQVYMYANRLAGSTCYITHFAYKNHFWINNRPPTPSAQPSPDLLQMAASTKAFIITRSGSIVILTNRHQRVRVCQHETSIWRIQQIWQCLDVPIIKCA